jgi:hypothetical protein
MNFRIVCPRRFWNGCFGPFFVVLMLAAMGLTEARAQFTTQIVDGTVTITGYTGTATAVTIPATIGGVPVTRIGANAFELSGITRVTLPQGLLSIGDEAFWGCDLTTLALPSSLTRIGDRAFGFCDLTSVQLPAGLIELGIGAFAANFDLRTIMVDPLNTVFSSIDGILFAKDQTRLLLYPRGRVQTAYSVPGSVVSIGRDAFRSADQLRSLSLPEGLLSIGTNAFAFCVGLTGMAIPATVNEIGDDAFFACDGLRSIEVAAGNVNFQSLDGALLDRPLKRLMHYPKSRSATVYSVPDGVIEIPAGTFFDRLNLRQISLPASVTTLGADAFIGCESLVQINLPDGITRIEDNTFAYCLSLVRITLPANITRIGAGAFAECPKLREVYFTGNRPENGSLPFENSTLATVFNLPGTTGWGTQFGGRPVRLWNPQIQVIDPNFGVQSGRFGFKVTGVPAIVVVIEACDDLGTSAWTALSTNTLAGGMAIYSDSQWDLHPHRHYRLRTP